ncbi:MULTISPECIES: GerMN domain-containing protein [Cyanophyceae]|uniref:GerMN domain-containing protein n=1 Tax=Cyanophyceae TaxID=3028117 RepID=UPI00074D3B6D|nr:MULTISPECIES: GerMN domain-containing protein [Cyanophyceae]MBF2084571.1 GerMN domain-containing protein [Thermoleptolyngbya sp. C42_A2020_037]BAU43197.1 Sporulation and spore germination [Leptolyngbya sp. O-77]
MDNHSFQDQPLPSDTTEQPGLPESAPSSSRLPVGVVAALAGVVLAAGSATAWFTWQTVTSRAPQPEPTVAVSPSPLAAPIENPPIAQEPAVDAPSNAEPTGEPIAVVQQRTVQVYWLKDDGQKTTLAPASVSVESGDRPEEILKATFEALLLGPSDNTVGSTIPRDTTLRSVKVEDDGVHVDLSNSFTQGGGSTSMTGRLAQVVYTATTLDPNAKVWITIEGKPLEVLGGEGILVNQPTSRADIAEDFSL